MNNFSSSGINTEHNTICQLRSLDADIWYPQWWLQFLVQPIVSMILRVCFMSLAFFFPHRIWKWRKQMAEKETIAEKVFGPIHQSLHFVFSSKDKNLVFPQITNIVEEYLDEDSYNVKNHDERLGDTLHVKTMNAAHSIKNFSWIPIPTFPTLSVESQAEEKFIFGNLWKMNLLYTEICSLVGHVAHVCILIRIVDDLQNGWSFIDVLQRSAILMINCICASTIPSAFSHNRDPDRSWKYFQGNVWIKSSGEPRHVLFSLPILLSNIAWFGYFLAYIGGTIIYIPFLIIIMGFRMLFTGLSIDLLVLKLIFYALARVNSSRSLASTSAIDKVFVLLIETFIFTSFAIVFGWCANCMVFFYIEQTPATTWFSHATYVWDRRRGCGPWIPQTWDQVIYFILNLI